MAHHPGGLRRTPELPDYEPLYREADRLGVGKDRFGMYKSLGQVKREVDQAKWNEATAKRGQS